MLASRTLPMGFNPAHVSGLALWLKASTGVTLGGTPLATGTTPPVVTIAATDGAQPTASGLRIEITTGGARGTALFKWSVNDGSTYEETGVATAATVVLASANITVSFPVGTYNTDNVYRATVSQWNDCTANALNLTQGTAARQPIRSPSDANMNGRPTIQFDGSNDVLVAASAADWKFAISGTGVTAIIAARFGALNSSGIMWSAGTGVPRTALRNFSTTSLNYDVYNDSIAIINPVVASAVAANTAYVFAHSYVESASPEFWLRSNGTQIASGNTGAAPSAANPTTALTLGAFANASSPCVLQIAEFCIYNRQLTAAEVASVERYMGREYGIAVA